MRGARNYLRASRVARRPAHHPPIAQLSFLERRIRRRNGAKGTAGRRHRRRQAVEGWRRGIGEGGGGDNREKTGYCERFRWCKKGKKRRETYKRRKATDEERTFAEEELSHSRKRKRKE